MKNSVLAAILVVLFAGGCGRSGDRHSADTSPATVTGRDTTPAAQSEPVPAGPPAASMQDRGGPERHGQGRGLVPAFPPAILWSHGGGGGSRPSAAIGEDRIYTVSASGDFSCLDRKSGEVVWNIPMAMPVLSAPALSDRAVFLADGKGILHAFDSGTGNPLWAADCGGEVYGSPLLYGDLTIVAAGAGRLSAFRREDGNPVWQTDLGSAVHGPLSASGDRIFAGTEAGKVAALSVSDGSALWSRNFDDGVYGAVIPWEDGVIGAAVRGGGGSEYFMLDSATGESRWIQPAGSRLFASAAVDAGAAVFAGLEGEVFSVDIRTGIIRWRTELYESLSLPPVAVDGRVLAASEYGYIHILDSGTGGILGRAAAPGRPSTAPVCLDGIIYLGTRDGAFFALAGGDGGDVRIPVSAFAFGTLLPYLHTGKNLELFLPPGGLRAEVAPLPGGTYYIEVLGEPLRSVTLRLINAEGAVLEENLGYSSLEKGFSYRFEAKKRYYLRVEPVNLENGLIPVRLRIRSAGAGP